MFTYSFTQQNEQDQKDLQLIYKFIATKHKDKFYLFQQFAAEIINYYGYQNCLDKAKEELN